MLCSKLVVYFASAYLQIMIEKSHIDLKAVELFVKDATYPGETDDNGKKQHFTKVCKYFSIVDGHLTDYIYLRGHFRR